MSDALTARNYTVGYFVGSLSEESINRALAKALIRLALAATPMSRTPPFAFMRPGTDFTTTYSKALFTPPEFASSTAAAVPPATIRCT
jgi:hypothetical protein